jgi:hypothetical protein
MPVTHFDIGNVKKKLYLRRFFIFVLSERQQL